MVYGSLRGWTTGLSLQKWSTKCTLWTVMTSWLKRGSLFHHCFIAGFLLIQYKSIFIANLLYETSLQSTRCVLQFERWTNPFAILDVETDITESWSESKMISKKGRGWLCLQDGGHDICPFVQKTSLTKVHVVKNKREKQTRKTRCKSRS